MRNRVDLEGLAADVVAGSGRDAPADRVLRDLLRGRRSLTPGQAGWLSRAVFHYFRWIRWLDAGQPLRDRIVEAMDWARRYREDPASFADDDLVARSVPEWVHEVMPVTVEWCRALQTEPALWLRSRPGQARSLVNVLGGKEAAEEGPLPDSVRYFGREDLYRHPRFPEGLWEIQDIASQAVGRVAAPQEGEHWWDCCAGEGGKTLHLADLLGGRGRVWATDRNSWRLERLKTRAGRAGLFNYRLLPGDACLTTPAVGRLDGALVDAPCSGLGTWGRNPHARWTTTVDDVRELGARQRALLASACRTLRTGGRLLYAVCTLTGEETESVADWMVQEHPGLQALPVTDPFTGEVTDSGRVWWMPWKTGGNGMFLAAWKR